MSRNQPTCPGWTRRDTMKAAAAMLAAPLPRISRAEDEGMLKRAIPTSGELLPVIGLGTWQVFDVAGGEEIAARRAIVEQMLERGASMIDSSPMYDRSERVVGEVVAATGTRERLFLATKVWTDGEAAGERQMQRSLELMQAGGVMDLMQVHNLRDLDTHMRTIRDWQEDGRIRYSGITDYRASALDELEAAMRRYRPQFIQINYSLGEREADRRVLPLARELGIAVIANRPYMAGRLFRAAGGAELPGWAREYAASWGQFFLKFIVGHPAVTCVIPATSKARHMADNLGAGFGAMPDAATRERMIRLFDGL